LKFLFLQIAVLLATVLVVLDAAPYNKRQYYPSQSGAYYPSSSYYGGVGAGGYSADDYYSPYGSSYPYYSSYNRRQPSYARPATSYRYPSLGSPGYPSAAFSGVFGWPRWSPFTRFGAAGSQPVKKTFF
jgi:hypothetical protein